MRIHVDDVAMGYKALPEGVYTAEVVKAIPKVSSNDNLMVSLDLVITSQGPTEEKTVGRHVYDNVVLTEEAMWKVQMLHKSATGESIPKGDYEVDELAMMVCNAVLGRQVTIKVENEMRKNTGELTSRVKRYIAG